MNAKRALIVDDSRSARVILSRMLEAYDLEVDAAESAEQALEYLRQTRPDVVFMDHLMPGMDGFQAIQAIKSNPQTAMIPVMMYTSQEGELYVSQARALGAVGVLPKTVKQGDVSRVLYQLHLLPERRETRPQALTTPLATVVEERSKGEHAATSSTVEIASVEVEPPPNIVAGELETAIRSAIAPALKEQSAELRRYIAASLEVVTRKLAAEGKPAANEATASVDTAGTSEALPSPAPATIRWPMLATVAAIALIPTIVLALLYAQTLNSTRSLMQSNAHLASVVEEQQSQLATLQQAMHAAVATATASPAATAGKVEREMVPYGETPLSGARLERLREMLDNLRNSGFHGKVKVATYVGEFCLTGNGIEGYSVAADDLPVKRCDLVGNPFDDSLTGTQHQSLGFANLIASVRQQTGDALTVEITGGGRRPSLAYPEGDALAKATAGEWNRIAAQNNRVEFVAEAME
ncbi:MAG TPA: response regulator [Povalibacter sp.]|nr:response regulator [Povalibacter sp.]